MAQIIKVDIPKRRREAERLVEEIAARIRCDLETATKQKIISDYCDDLIGQETAIRQIHELGLKHA